MEELLGLWLSPDCQVEDQVIPVYTQSAQVYLSYKKPWLEPPTILILPSCPGTVRFLLSECLYHTDIKLLLSLFTRLELQLHLQH